MTAPDLPSSLVEQMKECGVDVTTWDTATYDKLRAEMQAGTATIVRRTGLPDGHQIAVGRPGIYAKVLGAKHVLYPKGFADHQGCQCPTAFVPTIKEDKSEYEHSIRFVRDHFGIEAVPGAAFNFPPGAWPAIEVQEEIEYPIPFSYEAWPVSIELTSEQYDPAKEMVSQIDGTVYVWVKRPPRD